MLPIRKNMCTRSPQLFPPGLLQKWADSFGAIKDPVPICMIREIFRRFLSLTLGRLPGTGADSFMDLLFGKTASQQIAPSMTGKANRFIDPSPPGALEFIIVFHGLLPGFI
jgi:hypothetical protein